MREGRCARNDDRAEMREEMGKRGEDRVERGRREEKGAMRDKM